MSEYTNVLEKGIEAAKSGNRLVARLHLLKAADLAPQAPGGHLWLAWVAETPADAIPHFEALLTQQPDHKLARVGLAWVRAMEQFSASDTDAEVSAPAIAVGGESATPRPAPRVDTPPKPASAPMSFSMNATKASPESAQNELENEVEVVAPVSWKPFDDSADAATEEVEQQVSDAVAELEELVHSAGGENVLAAPSTDLPSGESRNTETAEEEASAAPAEPTPERYIDRRPTALSSFANHPSENVGDGPLVLICDPSPTVRRLVSTLLQGRGYRAIMAADGHDAVRRLTEATPDLILTDVDLPRVDGLDLCRRVHQHPLARQIPIVFLSPRAGRMDRWRGKSAGASDYIARPFAPADLLSRIEARCPLAPTSLAGKK